MAENHVQTPLSPPRVFAYLVDPDTYPHWLLGADTMRDVDDDWPAVGSSFHHRVGFGPLKVDDRSTVLECDPPRRLVLHVKATPLVQGAVAFTLEAVGGGTRLTLREEPAKPVGGLFRPLLDPATHLRNQRSLQRLLALMHRDAGVRGV